MALRQITPSAAGAAYGFLVFAALFWGGNVVAVRLSVGDVPPMLLACLRWVAVLLILTPFVAWRCVEWLPTLRIHWKAVIWMGAFGLTVPNVLMFVAAQSTSALSMAILLGATPAFVFLGALLWHRTGPAPLQFLGVMGTLAGVAVAASQGEVGRIGSIELHIGDVWVLLSCVAGAAYQVSLRHTPPLPPMVLFYATAAVAFVTALPMALVEVSMGRSFWPTGSGWAVIAYVGLFPTLLSSFFMLRGIQLIGPGRASVFVNLVPLIAAALSVLVLGEAMERFHVTAVLLVLGGIVLSETVARAKADRTVGHRVPEG